ncbi:3-deoxy-7-phosphoheptulonate synthase [Streptomyces caniscabiei]|uniref:3-deoxy-7-phosphoheptulonate synthase n=1 Tax=Streptomyces caniscabiei TaxID=2746961 RepID=UPI0029AEE9CA|nr:3-deoxy-7-phosphoheptulonate synthase [Streptomyces caniscabiei]MDX2600090.1 3-deoxy-7-phosphoheptulonate synthase [Streptomyces caniscabiei]MDX2734617.1 3-deoxy-7-phosphoheptulonate synthase [Streptomyces caniscabiei]MDX2777198.1 3-deoxy-7-phosphoheptulonate synthase [Streptomyces caniscabiei]
MSGIVDGSATLAAWTDVRAAEGAHGDTDPPPARQQPAWADPELLVRVRRRLAASPALVRVEDTDMFRRLLARVAAGELHVIQAGDCAEVPMECTAGSVARKAGVLDALAGVMRTVSSKPVLRVGRIAGQFAKPRSRATELVSDMELPVYRGHMVNDPQPAPHARRHDPARMLTCYQAASDAMMFLGWAGDEAPRPPGSRPTPEPPVEPQVWTSHEALVLDYEVPLLRHTDDGRLLLGSTHWPWIGERTRQLDGAHVALLADVVNPVACKVGPTMTRDEVVALCERLDPAREPGRLTLIARMGAEAVTAKLSQLVEAVRRAGHPVIWLTDPMHGNTVNGPDGLKTRFMGSILHEVREFQSAVRAAGGVLGGMHLETTPDEVTECVSDHTRLDQVGVKYTSLCDPRLNPRQAIAVAAEWRG